MNFLEKLLKNLKSISHESASYFDFGVDPLTGLKNEERKISSWMNQISNTKPSDRDIMDAVLSFRENRGLRDARHARLACWGSGIRFDDKDADHMIAGYILMEDETVFPLFLASVDSFIQEPKSYRRCYRGLIAGYFGYDPEGKKSTPAGKKNRELLRRYLEKRLDHVRIPGIVSPEWVSIINEHRNLLSDNPCERYGKGFLDGEQAELDLSASVWVSREIFRARFSAASECSDNDFLNYLPKLLNMLEDRRYSGFLDKGLPILLERYCSMPVREVSRELVEFTIKHRGTPWQNQQDGQSTWNQVSSRTLKKMTEWIILRLLKEFFALFSGDGTGRSRRYDFWAGYSGKIKNIHFALGREALADKRPEYADMKKRMQNRIITVTDGISSQHSNAVIIEIGDFSFVESGSHGSAVYIYRGFPFGAEKHGGITLSMIKNSSLAVDRIYHRDNTHGFARWENLFETHLENLCGISPQNREV